MHVLLLLTHRVMFDCKHINLLSLPFEVRLDPFQSPHCLFLPLQQSLISIRLVILPHHLYVLFLATTTINLHHSYFLWMVAVTELRNTSRFHLFDVFVVVI